MKACARVLFLAAAAGAVHVRQESSLAEVQAVVNLGPSGMEETLMSLLKEGNTPALLDFISKIKSMLKDMERGVLSHLNEEQKRIDDALKRFKGRAAPDLVEFNKPLGLWKQKTDELKATKKLETPALEDAAACKAELRAKQQLADASCGAFTAFVNGFQSPSCAIEKNGLFASRAASLGKYFAEQSARWTQLNDSCEKAKASVASLKPVCARKEATAQALTDKVSSLTTQVTTLACSAEKAQKDLCTNFNKNYQSTLANYQSVLSAAKRQRDGMKSEWEGIKRMSCLSDVFKKDDADRGAEIQKCKAREVDTSDIALDDGKVPQKASCPAPSVSCPKAKECLPAPVSIADRGYGDSFVGWYDVQGQGCCNDYCRWVGNAGSGGDPAVNQRWNRVGNVYRGSSDSWFSCKLAGSDQEYTMPQQYQSFPWKKCSGMGAKSR